MQLICGILFSLALLICQFEAKNITFSLKNDSEAVITLHTGKNTITIQANASYKFTKEIGTQIFLVEFGEKTRLLLTVKEELEGEKINFLELLRKE